MVENTLQLNQQGGGRIDIPLPEYEPKSVILNVSLSRSYSKEALAYNSNTAVRIREEEVVVNGVWYKTNSGKSLTIGSAYGATDTANREGFNFDSLDEVDVKKIEDKIKEIYAIRAENSVLRVSFSDVSYPRYASTYAASYDGDEIKYNSADCIFTNTRIADYKIGYIYVIPNFL